jgi:methylthioribose-1-phosphate isomerase
LKRLIPFSGAPAIAIVAALALAVELEHKKDGMELSWPSELPIRSSKLIGS